MTRYSQQPVFTAPNTPLSLRSHRRYRSHATTQFSPRFDVVMDMGWVLTFASPTNPTAQITLVQGSEKAMPQPNMSIEVEDVDAVHTKALEFGLPIVYPITNEPWGVRRFFVADPNGVIINVLSHSK